MINDTIIPCLAGLQKPFNLYGKKVNNLAEEDKKKIKKTKIMFQNKKQTKKLIADSY